jgi:hypothetical protein
MQVLTRPHRRSFEVRHNEWRSGRIPEENVWGNALYRVVTEGITTEQASMKRIAQIKQ